MNKKAVKTLIYIILSIIGLLLAMYYLKTSGILQHMSSLEDFKTYITILTITRPWEILAVSAVASANINIPLFVWVFIIGSIILLVKYSNKIEDRLIGIIKTI